MSNGLEALLQAAQFIEQQEKIQSSPTSNDQQHRQIPHAYEASTNGLISAQSVNHNHNTNNNNHHNINHNNNNNNNNININTNTNTRNSNGRHHHHHQYHVSSSAPAAGATFHHTNGLTITATSGTIGNGSGSTSGGSQLVTATNNHSLHHNHQQQQQHHHHHRRSGGNASNNDFEFSGNGNIATGNGVTIVTTVSSSSTSPSSLSSPIAGTAITSSNGRSSEGRISEDESSSPITTPNTTSPVVSHNKSPAFLLFAAASSPNTENQHDHEQHQQLLQKQQQQQQQHEHHHRQQQQHPQLQQQHNENNIKKLKSFTLVDINNSDINGDSGVVANKQMLLNDGIRIASPASTKNTNNLDITSTSRVINITAQQQHHEQKQQQHHHQQQQHFVSKLLATSSPSAFSLHGGAVSRYKTGLPLTPPPNSCRKLSESQSRIRSYSMSSHKFTANQLLLHNGASNSSSSNGSSHMMVDDVPSHMSINGSNHSPPRHSSSGSHYLQMQQQGSQGSLHHITPFGSTGRQRTISSNSNGAGSREVHNILEKNRRAHLKECYDLLKDVLPSKEDERSKKTSNLAVLNEALMTVKSLQDQEKIDESKIEQLAKEKITFKKRIVNLKRELGPKWEQFSIMFPDSEFGSIPSEGDNVQESASLSSGRGSTLYSSSSSLSSGGSSNIMFSPVGAGQLQTAMPTAISPVITKINNNNANTTAANASTNITNIHNNHSNSNNSISNVSLTDSPNGLPLALAATTITRGSPTPSTPSPSPSSSSGISSSSSLISSSPPMSGVISNGRSVTVNIPFQTTSGGATIGTIGNGTASAAATIIATSPSGQSHAIKTNNVLPTTYDNIYNSNMNGRSNNQNNHNNNFYNTTICTQSQQEQLHFVSSAVQVVASTNAANLTTVATINHNNNNNNSNSINNSNNVINGYRRKTSLSIGDDTKTNFTAATINDYEDVIQQPAAKFIKVYNGLVTTTASTTTSIGGNNSIGKQTTAALHSNNNQNSHSNIAAGSLQLSQVVGGGSLVVSPTFINAVQAGASATIRTQKILMNGQNSTTKSILFNGNTKSTNELGRLPGGAELNILPSNITTTTTTGINVNGSCGGGGGGIKLNSSMTTPSTTTTTTAFYHANGKLTLVNGGAAVGVGGNNGILLKENNNMIGGTNAALTPIIVSTGTSGNPANVGNNVINGGIHNATSTSFAQLLAASSVTASGQAQNFVTTKNMTSNERLNGKFSLSVGGQALPRINAQYVGSVKPMIVTVTTSTVATAPTTRTTMAIETTTTTTNNTKNSINSTLLSVVEKNKTISTINGRGKGTTIQSTKASKLTPSTPIRSHFVAAGTTKTRTRIKTPSTTTLSTAMSTKRTTTKQ